ncbi:MAG: biotin carboxylase N-terminal domain-containing protein [Limnobacter sp.]|nr:biotin carboxylase N-terminal domain-containing protein [Limnobacter sp.]
MAGLSRSQRPIKKLLVANRNEIAVRILKAARELGMQTVAVYSDADSQAPHVKLADEAWRLGGPAPADSYLNIARLIEVAQASGADAMHPGYGFVSENPELPKACEAAGIVLVGPGAKAMADMADKAKAKEIAKQAGLPCIPGFMKADASFEEFSRAAHEIGYPVMVKALAGGGGRGMRLVAQECELASALHSAQKEAESAFGDGRLMLEKAIVEPRHVEIQVLADAHGHAIHLGERDCSVQRRHQKIMEEAPSPAVTVPLRREMGVAALKLVQATGYEGAGTVEFLLDANGQFYFIEMNTRLQVEHGVTELITGIDLVQWQLRIASGEPLTLKQNEVEWTGHAIQGRLCAEDPAEGFLPQTGRVLAWSYPLSPSIRVDHALEAGQEVSPWYDSMLGKVMAHADTREQACALLASALNRTELVGFKHNASYLASIAGHEVFRSGHFSTAFLETFSDTLLPGKPAEFYHREDFLAAAVFFTHEAQDGATTWPSPMTGWSSTGALSRPVVVSGDGLEAMDAKVCRTRDGFEVDFPDKPTKEAPKAMKAEPVQLTEWACAALPNGRYSLTFALSGRPVRFMAYPDGNAIWLKRPGLAQAVCVKNATMDIQALGDRGAFNPQVKSPMNGKVLDVNVSKGDRVKAGDLLATLEAMKMEHRLVAKHDCEVVDIFVATGDQMGQGQIMIELKEAT